VAQHTIIVESASQPAAKQKRRKAPLILAGIGLIALVPVVGSTFAASISLNGGSNIEFGQGNQLTAACDTTITVTPDALFDSATDQWSLNGVEVTDIDADACSGRTFTVTSWNTSNASVDTWEFTLSGANGSVTGGGTYTVTSGSATADLTGSSMNATDLKTITIESSN
jgi:hypothetical protein